MSDNPYEPPAEIQTPQIVPTDDRSIPAPRWRRFCAAFIDFFAIQILGGTMNFALGNYAKMLAEENRSEDFAVIFLMSFCVWLVVNAFILTIRGQTLGKIVMKLQIVDHKTLHLLPFFRVFCVRYLYWLPLFLMLGFVAAMVRIPEVTSLGNLIVLVGLLFIFNEDRRCFHDMLAGSAVVTYQSDRSKLNTVSSPTGL